MRVAIIILGSLLIVPLLSFLVETPEPTPEDVSLMLFRQSLGVELPAHYRAEPDLSQVEMGRQLVHEGRADYNGAKSVYISKFYACTSCHNTVREDPDLTKVDPDARLDYAIEQDIPYLQASTFWGIVNREEWYNDDYVKKYGDLVVEANKSLEASIQLCAQECSQGRELEAWEMEAILCYLSSLELKVEDLDLDQDEYLWMYSDKVDRDEVLDFLDKKFLARSPATFSEAPADKVSGYPVEQSMVDMEDGRMIYKLSCQHCHRPEGESDLILDDDKKTARWLRRNFDADSRYSLYEIVRHGTYAEYGHREYMPLYTQEKMPDHQVESLRAYIEFLAE